MAIFIFPLVLMAKGLYLWLRGILPLKGLALILQRYAKFDYTTKGFPTECHYFVSQWGV